MSANPGSFTNRMPAGMYSLLLQGDSDLDVLMTNSAALRASIQNAKIKNRRQLTAEINTLSSQLKNTPDSAEFADLRAAISTRLSTLKSRWRELILPKIDEIPSHVCWLNSVYKPFVETAFDFSKAIVNNKPNFGGECEWVVPITADCFLAEQAVRVRLSELTPESPEDKVRYANRVGHRVLESVQLVVNNVVVDEYSGELYTAWFNTRVSASKRPGWLQCMGHSPPIHGEVIQDPDYSSIGEARVLYDGFQTISNTQPELLLYIPLLFWFNVDKADALYVRKGTNVTIKAQFAHETKLMTCLDVVNFHYNEKYNTPKIIDCDLYTNHIYMNQEVMDLFISRIGFSLIRVYRTASVMLNKNKDSVELSKNLRFAVEDITLYARPLSNEQGVDSLNLWDKNCIQTLKTIEIPVIYKDRLTDEPQVGINSIRYYKPKEIFQTLDFTYDNVSPYGYDSHLFYSAYTSYISKDISCNDNHVYYIPYTLRSSAHADQQVMGYANMSKCRKIYMHYESDVLESCEPVVLYVHARAMNFLIYNQQTASLQFNV